MENGNRASGDGGAATPLECDVGLGLNSEPSYPCKKTSFVSHSSPYHHHRHHQASEIGSDFGGVYGNSNQIASGISFKSTTDGVMGASGKRLFTATQWQELERQTMIYKYIIASIPVPPQLLSPLSPQSNRVNMGLRFSNGSDPEPWRCRRTDGKKWRCSRDVAPDQKYCERHSHKTRPRSRKPVEIQPHNTKHSYHPLLPSADTNNISNTSILSIANLSNEQTRYSDWFLKQESKGNDEHNNPYLNTTGTSDSDAAAGARRQSFIDAWSRIGSGDDCSLSLSMQSGGNEIEFEDHESFGMLGGDVSKWLNQGSMPGGPLGEALCLGIDSPADVPSSFH